MKGGRKIPEKDQTIHLTYSTLFRIKKHMSLPNSAVGVSESDCLSVGSSREEIKALYFFVNRQYLRMAHNLPVYFFSLSGSGGGGVFVSCFDH